MHHFHEIIFAHVPQHQPCPLERRQEIRQTRPRRQPHRSCDRPSRGRLGVRFYKDLTLFVFASLFICRCLSLYLSFFVFVFLCLCSPACWVQPCLVLIFLIVFVSLFSCLSLSLPTRMLSPTMEVEEKRQRSIVGERPMFWHVDAVRAGNKTLFC